MYLVAIAWMYVVLMMSVAEAASPQGTLLGAFFTFVLYGLVPLGVVLYILGTPGRRRARQAQEAASASGQPDAGGHASAGVPGEGADPAPGAPVRKEP